MSNKVKQSEITVVGAGMGGCLMSIYLARKGFEVDLLERRGDMRSESVPTGRSINLTLAARALAALDEVGLSEPLLKMTVPLKGRLIHKLNGTREYQPYGNTQREVIYSITRNRLNSALIDFAEQYPNIRLNFRKSCVGVDKEKRILAMRDELTQESFDLKSDIVIGADGVFSAVRQGMQKGERANQSQEFLDWGYKELNIPPGWDGKPVLEADVLHIWPRGDGLLLAMPNPDGSFTGTLSLPFCGRNSFQSMNSDEDLLAFCEAQFPDAVRLFPSLLEDLSCSSASGFITVSTDPWYYKDWIVLLGDACHTVLPFYGQGMNAAFEDCSLLADKLGENGNREEVFRHYQESRKRHTDALALLSKQNFVELRDSVRSPLVGARKKADLFLNKLFPKSWIPLYTLISHSTVPYADAVERARKQRRVLGWTGIDLALRTACRLSTLRKSSWSSCRRGLRRIGGALKPRRSAKPSERKTAAKPSGTWSTMFRFIMGLSLGTVALASLAGLITGGSRAALLVVINSTMNEAEAQFNQHLLAFLALAVVLLGSHVFSRILLIRLAQGVIFDLRMKLSREILSAPLRQVERTGTPRLLSALTDDVGVLSNALLSLPAIFIHIATIAVCLAYLGWLSITVLLSLVLVMGLGALSYSAIMSKGLKKLRLAREDQNRLFGHFRAITDGNKELKLHADRKFAFVNEKLEATADDFRRNSVAGLSIYALATSWGQFLFFGYIGLLLFWISTIESMSGEALTGYTLIILYIIIPLEILLMVLPTYARAKVAIENVNRIGLTFRDATTEKARGNVRPMRRDWRRLELDQVSKSYSAQGEGFQLGPLSMAFEPGELVFLMGGNGSGKSTLAKLLTGLYFPDDGEIRLDGEAITDENRECFRQHFSAVFSDFYLFDSFRGAGSSNSDDKVQYFMKRLQLEGVVEIEDGVFSTTALSSGQRKRLALLAAFVEDRPFYVFDEWAADQDPEFKKVFYTELLPEMKSQGKTVLVITHDERYAFMADRLIKLDYGRISEETYPEQQKVAFRAAQAK